MILCLQYVARFAGICIDFVVISGGICIDFVARFSKLCIKSAHFSGPRDSVPSIRRQIRGRQMLPGIYLRAPGGRG